MIEINLLPGAPKRSRSSGSVIAPAAFEALQNRYTIIGVATALVGLAAIAGMFTYQRRETARLDAREAAAARDSTRYIAVLAARRKAETTRDSVYQQVAIIKSIDDSRYTWPHILQAINGALPPYTWLTAVQQTSALTSTASRAADSAVKTGAAKPDSAKKPDAAARASRARAHADSLYNGAASTLGFRVVGQTVDIQALTQFMKALETSPFIRNVQLTRSDLVTSDNQQVTEFQLEAQTAVPPAQVLQTVPLSIAVH